MSIDVKLQNFVPMKFNDFTVIHIKVFSHLIIIIEPAIGKVLECATSVLVDLMVLAIQQLHQQRDAVKAADLLFDVVVHVAQVCQVGGCVRLDCVTRVTQKVNHLLKIW